MEKLNVSNTIFERLQIEPNTSNRESRNILGGH